MAIKTRKLAVNELDLGMFVSKLDVPWASTPFPIQGFYLENKEDIDRLAHFCRHVYVDDVRTNLTTDSYLKPSTNFHVSIRQIETKDKDRKRSKKPGYIGNGGARLRRGNSSYEATKTVNQEVRSAKKIYTQVNRSIEEVAKCIDANREFDIKVVRKTANKIVDSIIRNPDALAWLTRIQDKDTHTYQHTIRMTIWGISFGRHLGLPREELEVLALSLLMSSIGKSKLPQELFNPELTDTQKLLYQKHVSHSVEILQQMPDIPSSVIYVVEAHCERHNGSGYPLGLKGKRIPFLARVAGLVDYYDMLLNPKDSKNAFSSSDAISHLFKLRDSLFHGEMIEAFIQAMGVYPTGTLVELSSNQVAIIVEQKRDRRLRPKVAIVLDENRNRLEKFTIMDLQKEHKDQHGNTIRIIGSLPQNAYDIDFDSLHKSLYGKIVGWF